MKKQLLNLEELQIQYSDRKVFDGLNLSILQGQVLCLLGPSGSGKSTLLRVMAGLLLPSAGRVCWQTPTQQPPMRGFVFQDPELLPWRNVLENTRLPLELQKQMPRADQNAAALKALSNVHLAEEILTYPHQLSGGMRMRVSLARAMAVKPEIVFMDEPFAALDEVARFRLQGELRTLAQQENLTIVFVTHSIYEAAFLADRIILLSAGNKSKTSSAAKILLDEQMNPSHPRDISFRTSAEYQSVIQRIGEKMQEAAR